MAPKPYELTAVELLAAFEAGDLTVEAYAKSILGRIQERDATVKAWAYLHPSRVLEQARALDRIPNHERGALHGVAIGIKDVIHTRDMPTLHNSAIYAPPPLTPDAASVAILRQAGALILGKTTTTEFAALNAGPATANPRDPTRTPGGSSSGSGAAVADFQATLALGTQTGGSVIRPAAFNGVYGFKPTWNAVSREGQKTYSSNFDTLGFFARAVGDLEVLGRVFGLPDDEVPRVIMEGVTGLKIGVIERLAWAEPGPGTRRALEEGRRLLEVAGAEVAALELPEEFANMPGWYACVLFSDASVNFRPEYVTAKHRLDETLVGHVEGKHGFSRADFIRAFDGIGSLRPKWDSIAAEYDAVIVPSTIDEAPKGLESTGSAVFNSIWTALHVPVINIPAFRGEDNMPVGLSLTTGRFRDQALLEISKAIGKVWTTDE